MRIGYKEINEERKIKGTIAQNYETKEVAEEEEKLVRSERKN